MREPAPTALTSPAPGWDAWDLLGSVMSPYTGYVAGGFTHIAVVVDDLRGAENYYRQLLGFRVILREAPIDGVWHTFRRLDVWDGAPAPVVPRMAIMQANEAVLALEEGAATAGGPIEHVGLSVDSETLTQVRGLLVDSGHLPEAARADLLVFVDRYGLRWELSAAADPIQGSGERHGRWIVG